MRSESQQNETQVQLKNRGFSPLEEHFQKNNWKLMRNELDHIIYSQPKAASWVETDYFEIKLDKTSVHVSVPIKNSPYQYKTTFQNYYDATDYIEKHLMMS